VNAREYVNGMLFGGQHEEIIHFIERQERQLEDYRAALERIAGQHTQGEGWVHWRQIAREALDRYPSQRSNDAPSTNANPALIRKEPS
jgi:hypothetical protein